MRKLLRNPLTIKGNAATVSRDIYCKSDHIEHHF